jgi:hypothetical protein
MTFKTKLKAIALVSVAIFSAAATAQSLQSIATVSAGNEQEYGFNSGNIALDFAFSGTGSPVNSSFNGSFSGVDDFDNPQTMGVSATAYASAQYGILKAKATGTFTNTFYSSTNATYFNPNTNVVNEEGVPDFFLIAGTNSFTDIFTYSGLGAGFTVNFYYHIDGKLIGDDPYTNLVITNNGNQEIFNATPDINGNVDQVFVTQKYSPVDGQINHKAQFTSGVSTRVNEYADGSNIMSSADFSSTITLAGMNVYDADGNLASGWSVNSASGTTYPVPEPTTMTILGLAAIAAIKRKRK